jgi:hypothetical protein
LQRIQRCVEGNFTGVHFDYIEDFNQPPTSGLGLSVADYAAHLAWAVAVAKNLGLAVSTQEGFLVLAPSGIVPQLDMAITTNCMYYNGCDAYNILGECGSMRVPAPTGFSSCTSYSCVDCISCHGMSLHRCKLTANPPHTHRVTFMGRSGFDDSAAGRLPVVVVIASPTNSAVSPFPLPCCAAGKPWFNVEMQPYYTTTTFNNTVCPQQALFGFRGLLKSTSGWGNKTPWLPCQVPATAAVPPARSFPPAGWTIHSLTWQYQPGEVFSWPSSLLPGVPVYVLDGFNTTQAVVANLTANGTHPVCMIR